MRKIVKILAEMKAHIKVQVESFSNDDDGGDDILEKTNLFFTFEYRNFVNVVSTPIGLKTCTGLRRG